MSIDFYYTEASPACRFLQVLAKELGIKFNSITINMAKKEHLTTEFLKINPQHCVPTIVDNGFILWESGAIAAYLTQKYGKNDTLLYPKDLQQRAVVDQRLYFNNGVLLQRFGEYFYPFTVGKNEPDSDKLGKVLEAFQFLDIFLDGKDYVAGNCLTIADLAIGATIATFDAGKFDRSAYKNICNWYDRLRSSTPSFEEFNSLQKMTKIYESYLKK